MSYATNTNRCNGKSFGPNLQDSWPQKIGVTQFSEVCRKNEPRMATGLTSTVSFQNMLVADVNHDKYHRHTSCLCVEGV
jgi:hypothetical protein